MQAAQSWECRLRCMPDEIQVVRDLKKGNLCQIHQFQGGSTSLGEIPSHIFTPPRGYYILGTSLRMYVFDAHLRPGQSG